MRSVVKWLLIGLVAVLGVGSAALVWYHLPQRQQFYTDAGTIRQPVAAVQPRDVLWQPPVPLGDVLNTAQPDYEPRLSWDGLTLYFVRGKAGANADIYCATRTPSGWTDAVPAVGINSEYDDLGPEPAPDGQALYFYSDRPGGSGGYDVWVARRGIDGWQTPVNLGPAVNSEFNDYGPAVTPDHKTLYFASNRPRAEERPQTNPDAWPATVREDLFQRTYDLYQAVLTDAGAQAAEPEAALNTPANEGAPCVSPAGDFVYFASDRLGGLGGFDLYRARRLGSGLQKPANLGAPVNTPANELDPGLTQLGYALYFSSDRRVREAVATTPADYNLYYTAAREVFTETELQRRPPLAWAALWAQVWPVLFWLLLSLLLLLLLRALLGGVGQRKLGLLAQCLLVSMVAHALLMLAFSVWQVSATLSDAFRRGRVQVTLSTLGASDGLAVQITGEPATLDLPETPMVEAPPARPTLPVQAQSALATVAITHVDFDFGERPSADAVLTEAPAPETEAVPASEPRVQVEMARLPEVSLPADVRPIDAAEPVPDERVVSPDAPPSERGRIAIATSQPVRPPVAVAPVAASHADAREPADEASLASYVEVHDVIPPRMVPMSVSAGAVRKQTPSLELAVPREASPRAATEAEGSTAVMAAQTGPPRARPIQSLDAAAPAVVRVAPMPAATSAVSDAQPALLEVRDAGGVDLRSTDPMPATVDAIQLAPRLAVEVALPSETQPPEVATPQESTAEVTADEPPLGVIHGRVTDASTGAPLAGATVHLDLADTEPLLATTDAAGRFALPVPRLPDFVALSASQPDYVPASANVPAWRLRLSGLTQDFALEPLTDRIIALEDEPEVHHLGNDRWEGQINSQFQKRAEGRALRAYVELTTAQLPAGMRSASITLLAKGVQCPHKIIVNGQLLKQHLDSSPDDGSFGEFTAEFDPGLLREGINVLEIQGVRCRGDVDDFEFVNIRLRLTR